MRQNLDVLKTEIREFLETHNFVVFHGHSRALDSLPIVFWDTHSHPEYKDFLKAAEAVGAKLVVLHTREFSSDFVDNALDRLEDSELVVDDRRTVERRMREMRAYDGFTCVLELSFDFGGRAYLFDLRTEWYDEFSDLLDDIDAALPDEEEEDEGPIGGYFSKN
jgi:hypothetical protein